VSLRFGVDAVGKRKNPFPTRSARNLVTTPTEPHLPLPAGDRYLVVQPVT